MSEQVWTCTVLVKDGPEVPFGGDAPPREAVRHTIAMMLGVQPDEIWSGWGGALSPAERQSIEGPGLPETIEMKRDTIETTSS